MQSEQVYALDEIRHRVARQEFPFCGITEAGSAFFRFLEPSFYAGTAIHAGARVREDLSEALEVSQEDRFREEDPYTERFIRDFPIQIIARDSRFEYDINREKKTAIYATPDLAWGLQVWKRPLTQTEIDRTFAKYEEFHQLIDIVAAHLLQHSRSGVIFDCHSYNYQRDARMPWYENEKPVVNVGTAAVNRNLFGGVIDDFLNRIAELSFNGHSISSGENVVFKGGHLSRRISQNHHNDLLFLALEFRKIFMDEWEGTLYEDVLEKLSEHFSQVAKQVVAHPLLKG